MTDGRPSRTGPVSFLDPPPPVDDWVAVGGATDDQLAGLLHALRRYIHEAPDGMWSAAAMQAARTLTGAVAAHLRGCGR